MTKAFADLSRTVTIPFKSLGELVERDMLSAQVARFLRETGVDALAISIGN